MSSTHHTPHSSTLRRAAAVLGLAVVGGLGTFAMAAPAGATGNCPWYNPFCNGTPTTPTLPPFTQPPVVANPPDSADPNAGDPPTAPPEETPEAPDTPQQGTPQGGQQGGGGGGQQPQANPTSTSDDASESTETTVDDDSSDAGGSSALPIIAGVGALAAASGAGFYLYRARRA
jgi:hypothetical protein